MHKDIFNPLLRRRTILKGAVAISAAQIASPFVVKSLAEEPIKIGLDDPFTGTYAELGRRTDSEPTPPCAHAHARVLSGNSL